MMIGLLRYPLQVTKAFRQSIAYLPSMLALGYFLLGLLAVLPWEEGFTLPAYLDYLGFEDSDTPRTLLSTLIAGMISLVVFSFSMVMSVLSQAGGNFSHKLVFGLVTERHHQWVLGNYLGTILYILMLLVVPIGDEPDLGRSLWTYLGAGMVIHCLGLFVYFIHKASQTVQINSVVTGLHQATNASLRHLEDKQESDHYRRLERPASLADGAFVVRSRRTGFIQRVDINGLAELAEALDGCIHLNFSPGDFTLSDFPLFYVQSQDAPDDEWEASLRGQLVYGDGESVEDIHVHGMTQLMEVAVKALSPGINDPGTARLCINQLTDLLRQRLDCLPDSAWVDSRNTLRVTWPVEGFDSLLYRVFAPILHYGRDDISIGLSLLKALKSLSLYATDRDVDLLQAHANRVIAVLARAAGHELDREFVNQRLDRGEHRLTLPATLP
ncbi:DUF2254 domain-containing protein, partial [Halomonas campaniensis]|uniref:DUF2254 domain-containing protein n=1 Tax=Halomonas campaniensis TaxID=213554 RepID=UPI003567143C